MESFLPGDRPYGEAERRALEDWASELPGRPAEVLGRNPTLRARFAYQIRVVGPREYRVSGDGETVGADGVDPESGNLIDAKYVIDPPRGPFVAGSSCPDYVYVREAVKDELDHRFSRYAAVLSDPAVPARGPEVRTSDAPAAPFFEAPMREHGVPGRVTAAE